MARSERVPRIVIAAMAALLVSVGLLEHPGHGRGATAATQPSSNVAVIPGFAPKPYNGTYGVPPLPVSASQLASYHFTQLPAANVTSASLASYDTVLLYGIRWSDIPAGGQAAINAFATTHKVLIWDADDTGAQTYSSFIHPFSTQASSEAGQAGASVVSFPSGNNFLASNDPSSPYYLDPNVLVSDKDLINHMNAMQTGAKDWVPALAAANKSIPQGGWPLAWSYGSITDRTGLTIYSGFDADAFANSTSPNYAVKELALDLAAPFRTTPDTSCAPTCQPPPSGGGSGGGGGQTYAACSFAKKLPTHWVHGRVVVGLKTSVAAGITGKIMTGSGKVLATGRETSGDTMRLVVQTKKLPSNRGSRLRAVVLVNGQQACTKGFRLKVDNTRPRLLLLRTSSTGGAHLVTLRVSEESSLTLAGRNVPHRKPVLIYARRTVLVHLPARVRSARLILRDRAGNAVVRGLHW